MAGGYMGKLLLVNLSRGEVKTEALDEAAAGECRAIRAPAEVRNHGREQPDDNFVAP